MNVYSNWKLTFDPAGTPLVILDYGADIDSELRLPLAKGVEAVDLPGSGVPFLRVLGNNRYAIKFRVFTPTSVDTTARAAMMDSLFLVEVCLPFTPMPNPRVCLSMIWGR